jgi:tetratricopeptide (TPR) repeat protein
LDTSDDLVLRVRTKEHEWKPTRSQWAKLKIHSLENKLQVRIIAYKGTEAKAYVDYSFSTSSDSVNARIFYRNVPLPFSFANKNKEMLSWHLGDISKDDAKCVMTGIPVCANCHSFTADGSTLAMDVDYSNDKGNYAIASIEKNTALSPDKIISWSDYKREDGDFTFALLSQISPNGRYVVSTVKDRSIFVPVDNLEYSQLFFPFKGILAIYDCETNKFWSLSGADDLKFVQSNPVWSPDGKYILFARSERYYDPEAESSQSAVIETSVAEEFLTGKQGFQFDIYCVPFNNGKGGTAIPLKGASNNGKSNYFPRYTPDGKWIVFCQAENFMLLQRDSKLLILPSDGGEARLMNCNTSNMNSWHSFSPNSKWMVFASKLYGPYTQLMLTHIDDNGLDTPPVLLESFQMDKRAANIPEFVNIDYEEMDKIVDAFTETGNYYLRSATEMYMLNEKSKSNEYFDKAISLDPNNYHTHFVKIRLVKSVSNDELKTVIAKINQYLHYNPQDANAYLDRAEIYLKLGQIDLAIKDCKTVMAKLPNNQRAMGLFASLQNQSGNKKDALQTLNKIISQFPDDAGAWSQRGLLHYKSNRLEKAISDAKMAITLDKNNNEYYINLGIYFAQSGNLETAGQVLNEALRLDSDFYYALFIKGMIYRQSAKYNLSKSYFQKALKSFDTFTRNNPAQKPIITRSMIISEINRFK